MKKMQQLEDLATIVMSEYERAQANLQEVLHEESVLRAELQRLSHIANSARVPITLNDKVRSIGADVLWESWLSRTRSEINMKLARVLSTKEPRIRNVQECYGKTLIVKSIINNERIKKEKKKSNLDQNMILAQLDYDIRQ
jgi:hypothetical protein